MTERHYMIHQYFKPSNGALSKFHIFDVTNGGTKVALCGAISPRIEGEWRRGPSEIEAVLRALARRTRPYNNRQPCKLCIQAAQKFRSPLDRMGEIYPDAPE